MDNRLLISVAMGMAIIAGAEEVFVAPPDSAADTAPDGSRNHPFSSLAQARDSIRAAKKAGDTGAWTVHVRKGLYPDEGSEGIVFGTRAWRRRTQDSEAAL